MKKRIFIIGIIAVIAIIVIAALTVSILLCNSSDEPCVFLEGVNFRMSRAAVERQLGQTEETSVSLVSNEKWYTYHMVYEGIPVKVTLTFLQAGISEKLIGISLQNEQPIDAAEAASIAEHMTQQIREAYRDRDGYYERTEYGVLELGVNEGATGISFMIEQQETAVTVRGFRLY